MINYCSKEYKFWQKAYMMVVWFVYKDTGRMMSTLSFRIFENVEEVRGYVRGTIKMLKEKEDSQAVEVNLFQLRLKKLIKNKKDYWTKIPEEERVVRDTEDGPIGWIGKFLISPKLYDLLVVVSAEVSDKPIFDLASVFFLKSSESMEKIEKFMYFSDQVVIPTAMHSGIYEVEDIYEMNLMTGKIKPSKLPKLDKGELMD